MSGSVPPRPDRASGACAASRAAEARSLLARGLALHRQGALDRAGALYRDAIALGAGADAFHLSGLVAHQCGRHAEAERQIREAIRLAPANAAFLGNLGEVLRAQGRIDDAVRAYHGALAIDPEFADALGNLALALAEAGRYEDALPFVERACRLAADAFEPQMVRGDLLRRLSRFDEALAAYECALRLRPQLLEAWVNGGLSLLMLERNGDARHWLERALSIAPRSPQAATGLGLACIALYDLEAAERAVARALHAAPDDADARVALARLRRAQHRHEDAIEAARRALAADPHVQGAQAVMGSALSSLGRFADAVTALERAALANPQDAEPLCALARLRDRRMPADALLARIEALIASPIYGPLERADLHFAAGALHDEGGEHRQAFAHLRSANRHVRASFDHDPERFRATVDALIETVDGAFLAERRDLGSDDATPVVIAGMPRSGTTLIEQMLSMHEQVHGAGEVGIRALVPVPDEELAAWMARLDAPQSKALAQRYLARLHVGANAAPRITDKMPENYLHLGLFALLFPGAALVHSVRAAADTCLSVFMQHFAQPEAHAYAYDLTELGLHYREYRRLMRHWQRVLGPRLHDVRYERLVRSPESQLRALLAHCALPWDPRCLRHTENTRAVTTLSAWQARQPLYRSSLDRWRRYESELGELIAALDDAMDDSAHDAAGDGAAAPA